MFIDFEKERERVRENMTSRVGGRERGREGIPSRFCTVSAEPDAGLKPTNQEILKSGVGCLTN